MKESVIQLLGLMRVHSVRQVVLLTLLCTLFTIAVPLAVVYVSLHVVFGIGGPPLYFALALATAIPLIIAPPLSFIVLYMLYMMTATVDQVNNHVKFDRLTGLLSRGYFLDSVRAALPRGGAFLMVDADHFKAINDTHGHDIGDEALKAIASAVSVALAGQGIVGRLGGEEFAVFLPACPLIAAEAMADTIGATVKAQCATVADHPLGITVSIGVAEHDKSRSLEATMKEADVFLYEAKRAARARYVSARLANPMTDHS